MSQGSSRAIQEIKARLNIVDIVRRYVDLRRNGPRWVAPCPFHQETKPSFSVNEEEGFSTVSVVRHLEIFLIFIVKSMD